MRRGRSETSYPEESRFASTRIDVGNPSPGVISRYFFPPALSPFRGGCVSSARRLQTRRNFPDLRFLPQKSVSHFGKRRSLAPKAVAVDTLGVSSAGDQSSDRGPAVAKWRPAEIFPGGRLTDDFAMMVAFNCTFLLGAASECPPALPSRGQEASEIGRRSREKSSRRPWRGKAHSAAKTEESRGIWVRHRQRM